ncbi:MAG: phosphate ABC transporter substrate-binding protein [Planctomycetota bacterium]
MRRDGLVWLGAVGLLLGSLAGCGESNGGVAGGDEGLSGRLTLVGSTTVRPVASEIAKRFEALHPGVRIDVQGGGSSQGIAGAKNGLADVGMSSRELKSEEASGVTAHLLASDGLAFVVHADNPVSELSNEQLEAIYRGEIDNWSAVDGNDRPITVITRAEGRAETDQFLDYFEMSGSDVVASLVAGANQECVKQVLANPDAIVYMSLGLAAFEAERGTALKLLPLGEVAPTRENLVSGVFPVRRPMILVVPDGASALAEAFVEYALSPAVTDLIEGQSFVAAR